METTTKLTLAGLLGNGYEISNQKGACLFLSKKIDFGHRTVIWNKSTDELVGSESGYKDYEVYSMVKGGRYFLVSDNASSLLDTKLGRMFQLPFVKRYVGGGGSEDNGIFHVHAQYFLYEHGGELGLFNATTGKSLYEIGMKGQNVIHILGPYIMIDQRKLLDVKNEKYCLQAGSIEHIRRHYFMVQYKDHSEELEIQNVLTGKGYVLPFAGLELTHIRGNHFWIDHTRSGGEWRKEPRILNIGTGKITKVA